MKILTVVTTPKLDSIPKFINGKANVELKTLSIEQIARADKSFIPDIVLAPEKMAHYEKDILYSYIQEISLGVNGYKNIHIKFI